MYIASATYDYSMIKDKVLHMLEAWADHDLRFTTVIIMKDFVAGPGIMENGSGVALMCAVGEFKGGRLAQWGPDNKIIRYDNKNRWVLFNTNEETWDEPVQTKSGSCRFTVLCYTRRQSFWVHPSDPVFAQLSMAGFRAWPSQVAYLTYAQGLGVDPGFRMKVPVSQVGWWVKQAHRMEPWIEQKLPTLAKDTCYLRGQLTLARVWPPWASS